jgi:type I restriction enzyme S subunit
MIPKGWSVGFFEEYGEIISGATPSKKKKEYYTRKGIPWITPKDLSLDKKIFIKKGSIDITEKGFSKSSTRLIPENSVLMSSRAPIGYLAINLVPVTTNQGFKTIIPEVKEGYSKEYIFFWIKNNIENIMSHANGSTFKEISASNMRKIKVIVPQKNILKRFQISVQPIFKMIALLEEENQKLNQLRNTLLPKLMSGEVRVPIPEVK